MIIRIGYKIWCCFSVTNLKSNVSRYLKSLYPKAEETVILDVLAMVENNVQNASEQLTQMGYEKKELTPAPRLSNRKKDESSVQKQQHIEPNPPLKPKTADEKKKCKNFLDLLIRIRSIFLKTLEFLLNITNKKILLHILVNTLLQKQYKDMIPERVILMALESVDYSEEKALKILDVVLEETKKSSESDKKKGEHVERNVTFIETRYVMNYY